MWWAGGLVEVVLCMQQSKLRISVCLQLHMYVFFFSTFFFLFDGRFDDFYGRAHFVDIVICSQRHF